MLRELADRPRRGLAIADARGGRARGRVRRRVGRRPRVRRQHHRGRQRRAALVPVPAGRRDRSSRRSGTAGSPTPPPTSPAPPAPRCAPIEHAAARRRAARSSSRRSSAALSPGDAAGRGRPHHRLDRARAPARRDRRRRATPTARSCSPTAPTCPATSRSTSRRSASTGTPPTSTSGRGRRGAAGFLWTAPAQQQHLQPTVISWGLDHGMAAEFDLRRHPRPVAVAHRAVRDRADARARARGDPRLQPRPRVVGRPAR